MEAFSKFKRHSVIVYVNTKNKLSRQFLSPIITGCLNSAITGKIIPKAVISSFDQGTVYAKMSYKQLQSSKEYSSTAKVVKLALKGKEPPVDKKVIPNWQVNNDNRFYIGTFVELKNDTKLIIKKTEGNNTSIPMSKLSPGSQMYARMKEQQRSGAQPAGEKEDSETFSVETWQSSKDGKSIQATFVALKGDKITLKKKSGKSVIFPLSLLSEQSQKRARELGESL